MEKKIINPIAKEKKSVLDFCYVYESRQALPLTEYLQAMGFKQEELGLSAIAHFRDTYQLYWSAAGNYSGIVRKETANDICLSSIPPGSTPIALLYFNKDGYSAYCKKYKEYWHWIAVRNEERYANTMRHGKNYDAKNMMHVFRLLLVAKEIATEGNLNVRRGDRAFLLAIKDGQYAYDELLQMAQELHAELPACYEKADLPEAPDPDAAEQLLVEMRSHYYSTATGVQSFIFLNKHDS